MTGASIDLLQVLVAGVGSGVVETLPDPVTATGALFYDAWGLFGVAVLRKGR
jgi:hypothetical protein